MELKVAFRAVAPGDIEHVADNLCAGERSTLAALRVTNARRAIELAVGMSEVCHAAAPVGGGPALALVGVAEEGNLWMTATEEAFRDTRTLVRAGRVHVNALEKTYPRLHGRVDARHAGTLKWLQLLGFTVHPADADGPVAYCNFERTARVPAETT